MLNMVMRMMMLQTAAILVLFIWPQKVSCDDQPAFTLPLANKTVKQGQDVTFTCHINNIGANKVGWLKADTKAIQAIGNTVITQNKRISVSSSRNNQAYLHINNTQLNDAGPYMCQLNTSPFKSQIGYLDVYIPADIETVLGTEGIVEGGDARLECKATGFPPPRVKWTRQNAKRDKIIIFKKNGGKKREVSVVHNNVLVLNRVMRSQMGKYLCIADNEKSTAVSRTVNLEVNFRPVIKVPQSRVFAREGDDVVIECTIEAFPKGYHYWELPSGDVLPNSGNPRLIRHHIKVNEYTTRSRLIIKGFSKQHDMGEYVCIARNSMSDNQNSEGVIRVEPVLEEEPEEPETTPGYRFVPDPAAEKDPEFTMVTTFNAHVDDPNDKKNQVIRYIGWNRADEVPTERVNYGDNNNNNDEDEDEKWEPYDEGGRRRKNRNKKKHLNHHEKQQQNHHFLNINASSSIITKRDSLINSLLLITLLIYHNNYRQGD